MLQPVLDILGDRDVRRGVFIGSELPTAYVFS